MDIFAEVFNGVVDGSNNNPESSTGTNKNASTTFNISTINSQNNTDIGTGSLVTNSENAGILSTNRATIDIGDIEGTTTASSGTNTNYSGNGIVSESSNKATTISGSGNDGAGTSESSNKATTVAGSGVEGGVKSVSGSNTDTVSGSGVEGGVTSLSSSYTFTVSGSGVDGAGTSESSNKATTVSSSGVAGGVTSLSSSNKATAVSGSGIAGGVTNVGSDVTTTVSGSGINIETTYSAATVSEGITSSSVSVSSGSGGTTNGANVTVNVLNADKQQRLVGHSGKLQQNIFHLSNTVRLNFIVKGTVFALAILQNVSPSCI